MIRRVARRDSEENGDEKAGADVYGGEEERDEEDWHEG
jgi:hypothetical protein